jgi:hypothetical protein
MTISSKKCSASLTKDGKSILIVTPPDDFPDSRERPGWPNKRLRGAYELLGDGHPRIVQCVCIL